MVHWWMTISSLFEFLEKCGFFFNFFNFFLGAILFYSQSVVHEPWEDLATLGYKLNMKVKHKIKLCFYIFGY